MRFAELGDIKDYSSPTTQLNSIMFHTHVVSHLYVLCVFFFFSSRRRHTRFDCDWSSDVCSSDLTIRSAWLPSASHSPTRRLTCAVRIFSATTSSDRKFSVTNCSRLSARLSDRKSVV